MWIDSEKLKREIKRIIETLDGQRKIIEMERTEGMEFEKWSYMEVQRRNVEVTCLLQKTILLEVMDVIGRLERERMGRDEEDRRGHVGGKAGDGSV